MYGTSIVLLWFTKGITVIFTTNISIFFFTDSVFFSVLHFFLYIVYIFAMLKSVFKLCLFELFLVQCDSTFRKLSLCLQTTLTFASDVLFTKFFLDIIVP